MEPTRAKARGALGGMPKRPRLIRALKGAVCWPRGIKMLYLCRRNVWDMAVAELRSKYAGSVLGVSWALINPILIASVITFVFLNVFRIDIKNFSLFVLSGVFPWLFFSYALSSAGLSILASSNILRQFNLPREVIPIASVLANFLNFLIGWLAVFPVFLFFNPHILLFLPYLSLVLLCIFFFTLGLGMCLSVLNVYLRDIGHLLGTVLMFWLWVTPVFYSVDMVPHRFQWVYSLNPMTPFMTAFRDLLFEGIPPVPVVFIKIFLLAFFSMIIGLVVFSRLESRILKRI